MSVHAPEDIVTMRALLQLPFQEGCEKWRQMEKKYLSEKTYREYGLNIRTMGQCPLYKHLKLGEIDLDLVKAYQDWRLEQPSTSPHAKGEKVGATSVNHECGLLIHIREMCSGPEPGEAPISGYRPLKIPKREHGRAFTDEQRERLLRLARSNEEWMAAYLYAVISMNTSTGPKECLNVKLKHAWITHDPPSLDIRGTKNDARKRLIPMNKECLAAVLLAIERAKGLGVTSEDHYLFPARIRYTKSYDPNRPQTTFKTAWNQLRNAMGMPKLRAYDLRHHCITVLLENAEVSDQTVEEIAGHVPGDMKKRYAHIRQKARMEAVNVLMAKKATALLAGRKHRVGTGRKKAARPVPRKPPTTVQTSTMTWPATFWANSWSGEKRS